MHTTLGHWGPTHPPAPLRTLPYPSPPQAQWPSPHSAIAPHKRSALGCLTRLTHPISLHPKEQRPTLFHGEPTLLARARAQRAHQVRKAAEPTALGAVAEAVTPLLAKRLPLASLPAADVETSRTQVRLPPMGDRCASPSTLTSLVIWFATSHRPSAVEGAAPSQTQQSGAGKRAAVVLPCAPLLPAKMPDAADCSICRPASAGKPLSRGVPPSKTRPPAPT